MSTSGLIGQANQFKTTNEGLSGQQTKKLEQLYRDNLGRELGDEGRNYWGSQITAGRANFDDVLYSIKQSDEYKKRQSGASSPNASTNGAILDSVYQNTLGRAPDQEGRDYWMDKMNSGELTPEGVRQNIAAGAENQSLIRSAQQGRTTTVQDRMQGLLAEGSKYLDMARQRAAETANSRGFLNSSMAAGAGERAAIEAALPIAQQDAQMMTSTSLQNAAQTNQARARALEEQMQRWSVGTQQAHDKAMSELQYAQEQGLIDQKAFANLRGQYLDSVTQLARERAISINEIQTNPNIPVENKQQMIDNLNTMFEADIAGTSSIFSQMPMWQRNWTEAASQSGAGQAAPDTSGWNTNSSNYSAIRSLYRNLLGREIGQEGLDYWKQQLDNGATLADVEYSIRQSSEFKNR